MASQGKGEKRLVEEELEKDGIGGSKCGWGRRRMSQKFMKVIKLKNGISETQQVAAHCMLLWQIMTFQDIGVHI